MLCSVVLATKSEDFWLFEVVALAVFFAYPYNGQHIKRPFKSLKFAVFSRQQNKCKRHTGLCKYPVITTDHSPTNQGNPKLSYHKWKRSKHLTPSFIQPSVLFVQLHDGPVQLPKQLQLPQIQSPWSIYDKIIGNVKACEETLPQSIQATDISLSQIRNFVLCCPTVIFFFKFLLKWFCYLT